MANKPIVTVNVTLQTATVSRAGFGTPIFISSHHNFKERIRSYSSLSSVGDDFASTDNAFIAAQGVFASTPSVSTFKIGRREADTVVAPLSVANGTVHAFTITVNDGDTLAVSITAGVSDDEADVAADMKTAIDGNAAVAAHVTTAVVGAGSAGTLVVSPTISTDLFEITQNSGNLITAEASVEAAADALTAIKAEDEDFYFVTAEDHSETFILAMAAAVQATVGIYFVSTQEDGSISNAYSESVTDILAKLKQSAYTRTAGMWSQVADTTFPECTFVGVNAPYSPDVRSVVWDGRELSGVPLSKNSLGNKLTGTQELNLFNRNVSYVTTTAAGNRVLGGKTAGGTWIDEIRIRDTVTARVLEAQQLLILNQAGSKVPGTEVGKLMVKGAMDQALTPFIASVAIESFTTSIKDAVLDQNTRTLSGVKFEAVLAGAILRVVIDGILTNPV